MTISDLEFFLVEIASHAPGDAAPSMLVRLATESGLAGWGETSLSWQADELAARRETLLPLLVGRSVFDVEEMLEMEPPWPRPLLAALEMACWDLIGRIAGQPLCHLLGGEYRKRVPLGVRLDRATGAPLVRLAREMADQGFHWQMIASRGEVATDVANVAEVAEAVGDRVQLRLDGRAAYDMERARALCAELEEVPLDCLVDPLAAVQKMDQAAALQRQTSVPLALSRTVRRPADVMAIVRSQAAALVVLDVAAVGGLATARKCVTVAEAGGIGAALAVGPSLGVAMAAALQWVAATPALSACHQCSYHHLQNDVLVESLAVVDGMAVVPQGPGLGVEVDRAKLENSQVG